MSLSDLLTANGVTEEDLLELDEGSLTELVAMAPLGRRVAIGRELKPVKEVRPSLRCTSVQALRPSCSGGCAS